LIFYGARIEQATGNSTEPINYKLTVDQVDSKQRYYRLKIVDENGDLKYTDLIAGNHCGNDNLISKIKQSNNSLEILCNENTNLTIVNQIGQVIFNSINSNNKFIIDTQIVSAGIYYIHASNENGQIEVKKIIVAN